MKGFVYLWLFVLLISSSHLRAADLFQEPPGLDKTAIKLGDCPKKIQKSVRKELKDYWFKDELYCGGNIRCLDLDGDGSKEYICSFGCPMGMGYYFIVDGETGKVLISEGWLERNLSDVRIVSLVKEGNSRFW